MSPSRLVPEPGLVIPYYYLWRREHEAGEESGRKVRPCLIVIVALTRSGSKTTVAVASITTKLPEPNRSAVELPHRVREHLRLEADRSWIICDEINEFDWPGVDLAMSPSGDRSYGYVPDALLEQVRKTMRDAAERKGLKAVPRTE